MTDPEYMGGHVDTNSNKKTTYTRGYYYKNRKGKTVIIQDHSAKHKKGKQGSHFNVRPVGDKRVGKFPGTKIVIRLRNEVYMWYEYIDNVIFLKKLYCHVPELVHVRIGKISLEDEGTKVAIMFDMPDFADNIPEKWHNLGYNSLCIELNFWCIYDFQMSRDHLLMTGDISITKEEDLIHVFIKGTVNCQFKAECAIIQKVAGYINTELE